MSDIGTYGEGRASDANAVGGDFGPFGMPGIAKEQGRLGDPVGIAVGYNAPAAAVGMPGALGNIGSFASVAGITGPTTSQAHTPSAPGLGFPGARPGPGIFDSVPGMPSVTTEYSAPSHSVGMPGVNPQAAAMGPFGSLSAMAPGRTSPAPSAPAPAPASIGPYGFSMATTTPNQPNAFGPFGLASYGLDPFGVGMPAARSAPAPAMARDPISQTVGINPHHMSTPTPAYSPAFAPTQTAVPAFQPQYAPPQAFAPYSQPVSPPTQTFSRDPYGAVAAAVNQQMAALNQQVSPPSQYAAMVEAFAPQLGFFDPTMGTAMGGMSGGMGGGDYGGGDANGNMGGSSNDPGGNQGNGPGSSGSQW